MFGLITRHAHEQALSTKQAETARLEQLLDTTKRELAEARDLLTAQAKQTAPADPFQQVIAATRARLIDDEEARPIDGGTAAPLPLASQLLRCREQNSALHRRLAEVTTANQNCTCGGNA